MVHRVYHLRQYWQEITPSENVKVRHSPLASENLTITRKWCEIGGKLVLITNTSEVIYELSIDTKIGDLE